ncbi:hypothetical protein EST38_g8210 [Candolleomyces aberdarensis]|uniref:Uncharacterized protein n=1 Tax=Candolleomyces aberdarensis TaxID=2316362 RepID=A0A4Q2DD77_9AGAR|nr:hypothetical protein EST38_g8210 [Candolleomyces aberdarensis]
MRLRLALLIVAASSALPSVYAWGAAGTVIFYPSASARRPNASSGHEIVATIAQIHLHPSVLPVICDLMDIEPSDHSEASLRRQCHLAPIATWADRERMRMRWSSAMHHIEAVDDNPGDDCQYPGAGGWAGTKRINLLDAIKNVTGILADWSGVDEHDNSGRTLLVPTAPRRATFLRVGGRSLSPRPAGPREKEAFKFLVHFIGEFHQPLHLTRRQRGGHGALVYFEGRLSNLHRVWGTGLLARLIRIVPPQYSSPLPDRSDLPIPSQQIELALRHAIYDPLVRRVMWEGVESKWINDIDDWISCPAVPTAPAPESQSTSILSIVSGVLSNPWTLPRALVKIVSSASRERVDILPDGPRVCPYAWSTPVHALNCKYVWPPALIANATKPKVEEFSHARAARPPILDTPAYMAALDDNLVLEKLVAQGGLRLAGVLNWLFATKEA